MKRRILVIDDEIKFHKDIKIPFEGDYFIDSITEVEKIDSELLSGIGYDLFLVDLVYDETEKKKGFDIIEQIREVYPYTPIIVATKHKDLKLIDEARAKGANDYLYKMEFNLENWKERFEKSFIPQKIVYEQSKLKKNAFVGCSPQIESIKQALKVLTKYPDVTVLITGECGVGKSAAAQFFHFNNESRREYPFEVVHIPTISQFLFEINLFGGTYYSSDAKENIGRLVMANKGVLFLDDIGDLDKENQAKMLHFLQTKTVRPIGSRNDIELDVHIVAATSKNLLQEVEEGRFRRDLYQRLRVFPIEIPPLRNRREDIKPLIAHFLNVYENELNEYIMNKALDVLVDGWNWASGNVRELANAVNRMLIKKEIMGYPKITYNCLPEEIIEYQRLKNDKSGGIK